MEKELRVIILDDTVAGKKHVRRGDMPIVSEEDAKILIGYKKAVLHNDKAGKDFKESEARLRAAEKASAK